MDEAMIEYIVISYVFMFIFLAATHKEYKEEYGLKTDFKFWLLSPVMLPLMIIVKFIKW